MNLTAVVENAYKAALKARAHSHSPYSRFKVGAALQIQGKTDPVGGCNVENASYGGTVCAERVALWTAVAQFGRIAPEFLVVVTAEDKATVPCALCLQTLAEFCADDFPIYLGNEKAIQAQYRLKDLLPHPFRSFSVPAVSP
jgi:cytidine deaminase